MRRHPTYREVKASLTEPPRSRHSTLYLWFRKNRDEVARDIIREGVNWPDFAAKLGNAGLQDRRGKPPTATTAKQTWYRVRREAGGAQQTVAVSPRRLEPKSGEIAPGVRPALPTPEPAPRIDLARPKPVIDLGPAIARPTQNEGE